jgi:hypothetical protein
VTRWIWPGQSVEDLGRLFVAKHRRHRWPIPGARRCVIEAYDIDEDAGLAAVLLLTVPFRGQARVQQLIYEHDAAHGWVVASQSLAKLVTKRTRPDASTSGPAAMLQLRGGSGGRSYLDRLNLREADTDRVRMVHARCSWISSAVIDTSVEVDHLSFGGRRIPVPAHGRCVIVWRTAPSEYAVRRPRPRITAMDRNGRVLSELRPDDVLDTFTQAFLDELT